MSDALFFCRAKRSMAKRSIANGGVFKERMKEYTENEGGRLRKKGSHPLTSTT